MNHRYQTTGQEELRTLKKSDFSKILSLNEAEVQQTSPMDTARLESLIQMSTYCKVAIVEGQVAAFLISIRDGAAYESDNYQWFRSRLRNFLYVDRVVVSTQFKGCGIGSQLYKNLFEFAQTEGIDQITCEYNIEPPNPASRAFHDKFGFRELGTQWVAGGTKQVSLQAAEV